MSKKLIYLVCFVLVLSIAGNASAELVGHWSFDEGSGTVANDKSGYGNNGTFIGDPQWVGGKLGTALQLNGVDDFVEVPHAEILTVDSEVTVMAWINAGRYIGPTGADWQGIMAKGANPARSYSLYTEVSGALHFSTGGVGTLSTMQVPLNEWVNVAAQVINGGHQYYINGEPAGTSGSGITLPGAADTATVRIGAARDAEREFLGMIDDVRIYNHALTQGEIQVIMLGEGYPIALAPTPADGAVLTDIWVNLGWRAGDFAVSHDVYIGDNFDDVNDGAEGTFRGNQPLTSTTLFVGFVGYPYPDGLVPGTTYYWRIDEVNDTEPNSPWKGDVWSFWIQPRIAYDPTPADGAKFIDTDVELNWTAGLGASFHYVYFGDNFDDVNSAVEGLLLTDTTYTPGTLELDKTYYWRVDESADVVTMLKGDVWSFKTLPDVPITDPNLVGWWTLDEGMGTTAVDWSGHVNHGTLEGDPQWVVGYDADALMFDGVDDFVEVPHAEILTVDNEVTVMAWINAERYTGGTAGGDWQGILAKGNSTRSYSLYTYTDGTLHFSTTSEGAYVGSNSAAQVPLNEWVHVAAMVAGGEQLYYINGEPAGTGGSGITLPGAVDTATVRIGKTQEGSNEFLGMIDDVRIYNKALTQDEIQQAMRGDPLLAGNPNPTNGSTPYIREATPLSWLPGDNAAQHDVYFGIDRVAVADANASDTTGVYRGRQVGASYTPPDVEWGGGPYYWRIDEYNTDATISEGRIWNFTVADFIMIEDFEDYNDFEPDRIFDVWSDGWGVDTNGSEVGYADPNFLAGEHHVETTIVHGGSQSMPYLYENNFKYSEATYSPTQRDWTEEGVGVLSLWFYGDAANAAERMYVALNSGTAVYNDNANASQIEEWTEWTIDLQAFTGVGLTNVNRIAIGFGDKNNLQAGGSGWVFFDDIRLYRPAEPQP